MAAANLTANLITNEIVAGIGHTYKEINVVVPDTAVSDDYFTIDLTKAGATTIVGISGYVATTAGSVIEAEAPTTSVTSGTLTVTVGGTAVTKGRMYKIHVK